jgi:hypothetical protein
MFSITLKVLALFICLMICSNCSPILAPGEVYIDSTLSEQQVIDLLTSNEWVRYKYLDPYKGFYESSSGFITRFYSNGQVISYNSKDTNVQNKYLWRFIKASSVVKASSQIESHYVRIIQGKLITIPANTPIISQDSLINFIIRNRAYQELVFVTNQEFYEQLQFDHGYLTSYYRLKSK